tara:strand:- start:16831 stop:17448 length:618 start_codon:yes stop_codon:yes gene_type:complete
MSVILQLTIGAAYPVLRGCDHYWSVMMDFAMREETFTARDIFGKSNVSNSSDIRSFLKRLTLAGYIETVGDNPVTCRVVKKQAATPRIRHDGSVIEGASRTQAMWNLMRGPVGRLGFNAVELAMLASTDEVTISKDCAARYIKRLDDAGYLVLRRKGGNHRPSEWFLLPDMISGPAAPKVLKSRMVFDPNRAEVMGSPLAEEEQS